jgi:hypothetical protein
MAQFPDQGEAADAALAGGLIAAPAWAPPLSGVNEVLTTLTLLLGVALAVVRLWKLIGRRRDRDPQNP